MGEDDDHFSSNEETEGMLASATSIFPNNSSTPQDRQSDHQEPPPPANTSYTTQPTQDDQKGNISTQRNTGQGTRNTKSQDNGIKRNYSKQDNKTHVFFPVLFCAIFGPIVYLSINLNQVLQHQEQHIKILLRVDNSLTAIRAKLVDIESSQEHLTTDLHSLQPDLQQIRKSVSSIQAEITRNGAAGEAESPGFFAGLNEQYFGASTPDESDEKNRYNQIGQDYSRVLPRWRAFYKTFRQDYPSQSKEFWIQLGAAVEATMTTSSPPKPSSIIILSHPSRNQDRALCFAKKLANGINSAFEKTSLPFLQYSPHKFDMLGVSAIHENLKTYLKTGKAVVVEDLDKFQETSHLYTFHAFCENSNGLAHDTRATFLFTLRPSQMVATSYDWSHWNGQQIARACLNQAWESVLDEDKRAAIISRVSGNVLLFNDIDDCSYD